jgi:hypothetical protein
MAAPAPSERSSAATTAALLPTRRSYAVLWSSGREIRTGRLDPYSDRLDLCGREQSFSIPFSVLRGAAIARGQGDRLRGLPVLVLRRIVGAPVRIASLEGPGVLHELAGHVERAGLVVAV